MTQEKINGQSSKQGLSRIHLAQQSGESSVDGWQVYLFSFVISQVLTFTISIGTTKIHGCKKFQISVIVIEDRHLGIESKDQCLLGNFYVILMNM